MTLSELLPRIKRLTQDSRETGPDALFFAIEGSTRDGHDFLADVLVKGGYAVARADHPRTQALTLDRDRVITVPDTRQALGEAASRFFGDPSAKLKVCGVTGTNGKTTSTYLMEAILREAGEKPAVIGTVENRFDGYRVESSHTTPDAIGLQKLFADFLARGATAVSMEVSSHALDQKRVAGTRFEAALFTNLTQDHLDYHKTMEAYFEAKTRFFLDYDPKVRAIHGDDPYGRRLAELCRERGLETITFGRSGCNVSYEGLTLSAAGIEGDVAIDWRGSSRKLKLRSPLLGAFNAQNLCGAIAVGVGLGLPVEKISRALEHARQVPGRMETVPNAQGLTVVVDYAHTPDALENALKTLRPLCARKLVCVFGCGGDRDPTKRPVMGALAERLADVVYATSDNPRTEDPERILDQVLEGFVTPAKAHRISDRRAAIAEAIKTLRTGDILLIAGKGHEDYQIIGTKKLPFDDRKVALENL